MTNMLFILAIAIYMVINIISTAKKYDKSVNKINENIDETEKEESK